MNIKVEFSSDSLWGQDGCDAIYDQAASEAKFARMLQADILVEFPEATVEVEHGSNDKTTVNCDGDEHEIMVEVADIQHQCYVGWDWLVMA